jgi:hypothetical protein
LPDLLLKNAQVHSEWHRDSHIVQALRPRSPQRYGFNNIWDGFEQTPTSRHFLQTPEHRNAPNCIAPVGTALSGISSSSQGEKAEKTKKVIGVSL